LCLRGVGRNTMTCHENGETCNKFICTCKLQVDDEYIIYNNDIYYLNIY
jgi:hypothetical protein